MLQEELQNVLRQIGELKARKRELEEKVTTGGSWKEGYSAYKAKRSKVHGGQ